VTAISNSFLGIRTRKESCRTSEKGSKEKLDFGVPGPRPEEK